MRKFSINFKPILSNSEQHNRREVVPEYVLKFNDEKKRNESFETDKIQSRQIQIKNIYEEKVKQKMQKKTTPIREAVVVLSKDLCQSPDKNDYHVKYAMPKLKELSAALKEKYGIECFQIHIHGDEGKDTSLDGRNWHAHMIFDWQNKEKGKMFSLTKQDMADIQTLGAKVLEMKRGSFNSTAERLEQGKFREEMQRLDKVKEEKMTSIQNLNKNIFQLQNDLQAKSEKAIELEAKNNDLEAKIADLEAKSEKAIELEAKDEKQAEKPNLEVTGNKIDGFKYYQSGKEVSEANYNRAKLAEYADKPSRQKSQTQ